MPIKSKQMKSKRVEKKTQKQTNTKSRGMKKGKTQKRGGILRKQKSMKKIKREQRRRLNKTMKKGGNDSRKRGRDKVVEEKSDSKRYKISRSFSESSSTPQQPTALVPDFPTQVESTNPPAAPARRRRKMKSTLKRAHSASKTMTPGAAVAIPTEPFEKALGLIGTILEDYVHKHPGRDITRIRQVMTILMRPNTISVLKYFAEQDMVIHDEHYVDVGHLMITIFKSLYNEDPALEDMQLTIDDISELLVLGLDIREAVSKELRAATFAEPAENTEERKAYVGELDEMAKSIRYGKLVPAHKAGATERKKWVESLSLKDAAAYFAARGRATRIQMLRKLNEKLQSMMKAASEFAATATKPVANALEVLFIEPVANESDTDRDLTAKTVLKVLQQTAQTPKQMAQAFIQSSVKTNKQMRTDEHAKARALSRPTALSPIPRTLLTPQCAEVLNLCRTQCHLPFMDTLTAIIISTITRTNALTAVCGEQIVKLIPNAQVAIDQIGIFIQPNTPLAIDNRVSQVIEERKVIRKNKVLLRILERHAYELNDILIELKTDAQILGPETPRPSNIARLQRDMSLPLKALFGSIISSGYSELEIKYVLEYLLKTLCNEFRYKELELPEGVQISVDADANVVQFVPAAEGVRIDNRTLSQIVLHVVSDAVKYVQDRVKSVQDILETIQRRIQMGETVVGAAIPYGSVVQAQDVRYIDEEEMTSSVPTATVETGRSGFTFQNVVYSSVFDSCIQFIRARDFRVNRIRDCEFEVVVRSQASASSSSSSSGSSSTAPRPVDFTHLVPRTSALSSSSSSGSSARRQHRSPYEPAAENTGMNTSEGK